MTNTVLHKISRFFHGTGSVIGTPSGDARGHLRVPVNTMYEHTSGTRLLGH